MPLCPLGRPPKIPDRASAELRRKASAECNKVEGTLDTGKRVYNVDDINAQTLNSNCYYFDT